MDLKATLGQLLALFVVVDVSDISGYIPKIASISTNVTDKAFVLVQPNCIFNQYPTTNVWLVVAGNTTHVNLNDLALGTPVPYSSFKNGSSNYYHTFFLPATQYPCSLNSSTSMNLLQIGCETGCTENSFCNGPLRLHSPMIIEVDAEVFDIMPAQKSGYQLQDLVVENLEQQRISVWCLEIKLKCFNT
ncbi:uroplakin-3b-like [Mixophyes fleayi]|uniref:uroplakin-3b-like n=1 Tax=Mixophyes fleayi TaxID=3061075 RepID=UPI003F4D78E7